MDKTPDITPRREKTDSERIVKDLMHCARFLRSKNDGKWSQRRVLMYLKKNGPVTQRVLLEEMGVRASSLSELLGKLENKGWVVKAKSDTDKRNYNVSVTEEGTAALEEMQALHQASIIELFSDFPAEDQAQLAQLLSKLRDQWREQEDCTCHHPK